MAEVQRGGQAEAERTAGQALHARLLAADPVAPAELVERYLEPLVRRLRGRYPRVDSQLLETIATDSLLRLAMEPARYDPARASLAGYLTLDADGDVRNALVSERRRQRRELPLEDVELSGRARNPPVSRSDDPAVLVAGRDERLEAATDEFCRELTPVDAGVLRLILDGERRTERYAPLLGVEGRPPKEQAAEVKRVKDRLLKRLQRWLRRRGYGG